MTLAAATLTLAEIQQLGRQARRVQLDYFGDNPFGAGASDASFEALASKWMAWSAGWLEEDAGRTESVQRHLLGEVYAYRSFIKGNGCALEMPARGAPK